MPKRSAQALATAVNAIMRGRRASFDMGKFLLSGFPRRKVRDAAATIDPDCNRHVSAM